MAADTWVAASTAPDAAISLARVEIERFILASSQSLLGACSPRRGAAAGAGCDAARNDCYGVVGHEARAGGFEPPAVALDPTGMHSAAS